MARKVLRDDGSLGSGIGGYPDTSSTQVVQLQPLSEMSTLVRKPAHVQSTTVIVETILVETTVLVEQKPLRDAILFTVSGITAIVEQKFRKFWFFKAQSYKKTSFMSKNKMDYNLFFELFEPIKNH